MRNPFSLPAKILSWLLALSFIIACWGTEPDVPSPGPTPPNPTQDTKAPVITLKIQEQNVIAGVKVDIKTDQILFDQTVAATWKDDISKSCKVEVGFVGEGGGTKAVKSGDRLEEPGKLQIKVTDEAGNDSSAEIKLTRVDSWAPEISILIGEKNVVAGVKVKVEANQLFLDDQVTASWKDDYSESLTVDIQHVPENSSTGKAIESGETLFDAGKLHIAVQDDAKNKSTAEIKLTSVAITGLESLIGKELTVDVPVNLLQGLTISEGLTLQKVEVEQDGVRSEIADPEAYSPQIPGTIGIVLTLARTDESTIEVKVDWISVKGIKYSKFSLTDLKPVDILPIIGQVESGDKNVYDHIEHLRVAEATRIRDMMWEYGAGNYSIKDYKELMGRLNIGIRGEIPLGYDNYEIICSIPATEPTSHASHQWSILNSLIQHATIKVLPEEYENSWQHNLMVFLEKHPNSINVFWCSSYTDAYNLSDYYGWMFKEDILDLSQKKNLIFFAYASNMLYMPYGSWQILINKLYNWEYEADEHGGYSLASMTNSDKNTHPGSHLFVTVANQADGNIDQTNQVSTSTKFPVGFADNVLFSGRAFPYKHYKTGKIVAEGGDQNNGRYSTSYTNPLNACMTALCFQMFAEVPDVDVLLEMIRSTCLTDHIHLDLNGDGDTNDIIDGHPETVPLQLINPGGFFKKYCMPSSIPTAIGTDETINLEKGYYKGMVFDIPGAEVLVNGEWIAFDAKNKDLILAQNPMNLEWRLNGALLRKYGYTPGQTLQGQIITVDDLWNGLRLEKDITIQIN